MKFSDLFHASDTGPVEYRVRNVLRQIERIPGLNPDDFCGREMRAFNLQPACSFYNKQQALAFGAKLKKLTGGQVMLDDTTHSADCKFAIKIILRDNHGSMEFGRWDAWALESSLKKIQANANAIHALMKEHGAALPPLPPEERVRG